METAGALAMKKVEKNGDMKDDVTYRWKVDTWNVASKFIIFIDYKNGINSTSLYLRFY